MLPRGYWDGLSAVEVRWLLLCPQLPLYGQEEEKREREEQSTLAPRGARVRV